jgi:hypothetical protein
MKVDERRWVMITVDGRTASTGEERGAAETTVVTTVVVVEIHGGEFDPHSGPYSFSTRSSASGKFGSLDVKYHSG